jgi:hypothetical protein
VTKPPSMASTSGLELSSGACPQVAVQVRARRNGPTLCAAAARPLSPDVRTEGGGSRSRNNVDMSLTSDGAFPVEVS